jgi:hypothetical protein
MPGVEFFENVFQAEFCRFFASRFPRASALKTICLEMIKPTMESEHREIE